MEFLIHHFQEMDLKNISFTNFIPNVLKSFFRYQGLATAMGIVEIYPDLLFPFRTNEYRISDYCTGDLEQRQMCDLFGIKQILVSIS